MTTKTLHAPELIDVLNALKQDIFKSLNCVKIGKIDSFDQTKKTASIQIMFKRVLPDKVISYPLLVDCPVFTLQGGGGAIQMPIQAGDPCIVLFADRNIDNWYSAGSETAPADLRCHHLSDGLAIVGINAINDTSILAADANVNIRVPASKKLVVTGTGATAEILGNSALILAGTITAIVEATLNDWIKNVFDKHAHATAAVGLPSAPIPIAPDVIAKVGTSVQGTTKLKGS